MGRLTDPTLTRVRLYRVVRTAHLDRAHQMEPATILYAERRYDFDEDLTAGLDLRRTGPLQAARLLLTSDVRAVEVNEPASLHDVRWTAACLSALLLRSVLRGRRPLIVTYAIDNADPFAIPRARGLRPAIGRRLDVWCARFVWRSLDRIAFGTHAAQDSYAAVFGPPRRRATATLVPAVPAPCEEEPDVVPDGGRVVFLGAFVQRKGFELLLAAWPTVRQAVPGARLALIGKGALEDRARAAAAADPTVETLVDPPRRTIHRVLAESSVLVLPSQPSPTWREQVGLPIVEGLAHGCAIVTTDETGLVPWLTGHGHHVVPGTSGAQVLAEAVVTALRAARPAADVRSDLPAEDGRLAADRWLFAPAHRPA